MKSSNIKWATMVTAVKGAQNGVKVHTSKDVAPPKQNAPQSQQTAKK